MKNFEFYAEDLDLFQDSELEEYNLNDPQEKMRLLHRLEGLDGNEPMINEEQIGEYYSAFLTSSDMASAPQTLAGDILEGLERHHMLDKEHIDLVSFPEEARDNLCGMLENRMETTQDKAALQGILDPYYEFQKDVDERLQKAIERELEDIAEEGQDLSQKSFDTLDAALHDGSLTNEDLAYAHATVRNGLEFALKGSTSVSLDGVRAAEIIERKYGKDSDLYKSLPENKANIRAELIVTKDEGITDLNVAIKEARRDYYKEFKDAVEHFAGNFSKDQEKEKESFYQSVWKGLNSFSEKAKDAVVEAADKMLNKVKTFDIKKEAKENPFLRETILKLRNLKDYIKEPFELRRELSEKLEEISQKYENEGRDPYKSDPEDERSSKERRADRRAFEREQDEAKLEYNKKMLERGVERDLKIASVIARPYTKLFEAVGAEKQAERVRAAAFRAVSFMIGDTAFSQFNIKALEGREKVRKLEEKVENAVENAVEKAGNAVKKGLPWFEQEVDKTFAEMEESFQKSAKEFKDRSAAVYTNAKKNFNKLIDGAIKRWNKDTVGMDLSETASMPKACEKMIGKFEKEVAKIYEEQRKDIREMLKQSQKIAVQASKEAIRESKQQIKEYNKEFDESRKEKDKNIEELQKKMAKLDKQIAQFEKDPDLKDAAESLKKTRAEYAERIAKEQEKFKDIHDTLANKINESREQRKDALESIKNVKAERNEKNVTFREKYTDKQVKEAVEAVNKHLKQQGTDIKVQGLTVQDEKGKIKAEAELSSFKPTKEAKNYADTLDKNNCGQVLHDAAMLKAQLETDKAQAIRDREEAKKNARGIGSLIVAARSGLLNKEIHDAFAEKNEKGFTKKDAEAITKATSDVKKEMAEAEQIATLDFVQMSKKEYALERLQEKVATLQENSCLELMDKALTWHKEGMHQRRVWDTINKDPWDELLKKGKDVYKAAADLERMVEDPSLTELGADLICQNEGQLYGVYSIDDDAPKSVIYSYEVEGVDLQTAAEQQKMLEYAKAKGFSPELTNEVFQKALSASQDSTMKPQVKVQIMNDSINNQESYLCVSVSSGDVTAHSLINKEGEDIAVIRTNEKMKNIYLNTELAFGRNKDGEALYDISVASNMRPYIKALDVTKFETSVSIEAERAKEAEMEGPDITQPGHEGIQF